jgi:fructokinase
VEAGGTKVVCVIGTGPDHLVATRRIEVTDPAATLGAAAAFFREAVDGGVAVEALGIGSFGPVELRPGHPRFGHITATPKPGWSGADVVGPFVAALGIPVGFDTDVNAAALGEARWGAGRGLRSFVYLTLGTGIGGGAVVDGGPLHGLGHPEMGHVAVPRMPGDQYSGRCPFHGECWEGLASGPAIAARFGRRAEELEPEARAVATRLVAWYLAAGCRSLVYALAPERIVVGGGLVNLPGLLELARPDLAALLTGYPGLSEHEAAGFLVPAALGQSAGPAGTLVLAELAHRAAAAG